MNLINVIGGVLVGAALGWAASLLFLYFVPLPRVAKMFAIILCGGSALTAFGAGVGILSGGVELLGVNVDLYRTAFVSTQFVGTWGFAISMLFYIVRDNTIVNTTQADDTNTRIREMQTRGQGDQPLETLDREEGHDHRASIDARLQADTDARTEERRVDTEVRAEETRKDREERKEETRKDREERADERADERDQ